MRQQVLHSAYTQSMWGAGTGQGGGEWGPIMPLGASRLVSFKEVKAADGPS